MADAVHFKGGVSMNCKHCGAPLKGWEKICPYCNVPTDKDSRKSSIPLAGMKYVSGGLMITLSIVTFGIYNLYWYFSRRKNLNNLSPSSTTKFPDVALWVWLGLNVLSAIFPPLGILSIVASTYLVFTIRSMVRSYALKFMDKTDVAAYIVPSGAMLFFFGSIYLQFEINKMIDVGMLEREIL